MSPPPAIPDHELFRPIGRGAYGEVWLARNVMGAWRAVKVVGRAQFSSERPYEREFEGIRRFEPVSRSSGGLVHVLHVGRNNAAGYFYYVMELADPVAATDGDLPLVEPATAQEPLDQEHAFIHSYSPRTLRSELKRRGALPTAEALRVALEVASGLAQLHRHGLVHRDVKPGNIIFVNGRAKLADIGLVSAGGEGRTFVGTEGYIPPEGPGSAAADLYALGVVLYEASTGFTPERFPYVPPEWFSGGVGDGALELHEVILKAGEGRRENRYQSVDELQADLALLQSGQSVRRVRALERRYARLRISGIAGTTLLLCALAGWLFADYRARVAADNRAKETALREQAQKAQSRAEDAEQNSRRELYAALLEQAKATVRSGELGQRVRALDAIRRAAVISNTAELRGAALAALALPDMRFERRLPSATNATLVQFDPRFERVAIVRGPGPVEIRAGADEHLITTLPASTNLPVFTAQWSGDGRFLAVKRDHPGLENRRDLEIWDVRDSRLVMALRDVEHGAAAFHPKLPRLLASLRDGTVALWDLATTNELARFQLDGAPNLLAFSPDGNHFAASHHEKAWTVSIHDARNGAMLSSHPVADVLQGMDWDPLGRWVATADHSGAIQLMDTLSGEVRTLGRHKAQAVLVAFNSDGGHLLSGGWERELIYWDLERMERAFTIPLNSYRAQFRGDGGECAIISINEEAQLFAVERPAGRRGFEDDLGARLVNAAFSRDRRWLAASASRQLGVWDLSCDGPPAVEESAAEGRVLFSPSGELFASTDNAWLGWRVSPATNSATRPGLQALVLPRPRGFTSLCLASDRMVFTEERGSRLVTPGSDNTLNWTRTVDGLSRSSPDGRWLGIYQPFSPMLHIYRLPELNEVAILTNRASVLRFDFSPLGDELAVSSAKGIEFWSTAAWKRTRTLSNYTAIFYAPDGRTCWLTSDYRTAGLHDARTFELLLPLPVGTLPLAVSEDGRFLAACVDLRWLQVWDLAEVRKLLAELGLDWSR